MAILGIGIDLVHIPRILHILTRAPGRAELFSRRILTEREQLKAKAEPLNKDPVSFARYLALRWAAKEAAYKAAYPSCRLSWKEVEIVKAHQDPKPMLLFHPRYHDRVCKSHLSISHDGDLLIAQVLLESP
ncbi:MAG: 4'-phosphopantetheinyl transferase [Piptocephalis tieghemiana]|nr:MAG: 4'-phosphopantetheinyl transferase [Piptocephalis tieghemiana]